MLRTNKAPFYADVRVKTCWLLICAFVIFGSFAYGFSYFRSSDTTPELQLIDMDMQKKIRNFSAQVDTGLFIKNFEDFSIENDLFTFGAVVWFSFPADGATLDTISRFSFMNAKTLEKSAPDIRIEDGGRMFVKYDVRASIKSNLRYYGFPFDDHLMSIVMTNNYVTPDELYFQTQATGFGIAPEVFTAQWRLVDTKNAWGYSNLILDTADRDKAVQRPAVVYSLLFQKPGVRGSAILFLPLFASLFLGFIALLLHVVTQSATRFSLSLTAFTATLSYRYVIDKMLPPVGYFTLIDSVYTVILLCVIALFAFQVVISRQNDDRKKHDAIARYNTWFYYSITLLFTVACVYLIP